MLQKCPYEKKRKFVWFLLNIPLSNLKSHFLTFFFPTFIWRVCCVISWIQGKRKLLKMFLKRREEGYKFVDVKQKKKFNYSLKFT